MAGIQMPLPGVAPRSDWEPPRLTDLPRWRDAARVGIDIETCDPQLGKKKNRRGTNRGTALGPGVRRDGYVVGVSFALEDDDRSYYLPMRHASGGNLDADRVAEYLQDQAREFRGELVVQNASYDLDYLFEQEGVDLASGQCRVADVGVLECVLDELADAYGLDDMLERHGLPTKDEAHLRAVASAWGVDPKKELWKLPASAVGGYAEYDARALLPLYEAQRACLREDGQGSAWALEQALTPILLRVMRRGIRVDQERLSRMDAWAAEQERTALDQVHHLTGVRIKPGDTHKEPVVAPALLAAGIELKKTRKTRKWKIDAALLDRVDHPVGEAIRWARKMDKVQQFSFAVRAHSAKGRLHCTLNQARREDEEGELKGTRSGRLSATHPNLQQQFARDPEIGPRWRSIFRPEPGELWCSADYSQQEPRMAVHYAALQNLPGARGALDYYARDPNADFHSMMAELTGLARKDAKQVFLALAYGMGGAKFCRELGLPTATKRLANSKLITVAGPEGQAILDQFSERAPWLGHLAKKVEAAARRNGAITLLKGVYDKLVHFPVDAHGNYDWTHKAFNRLIQGGSALQMKQALVDADAAGCYVTLSVHDELCASVRNDDEARELADCMRSSVDLLVPSKVDVEMGPSWGQSMVEEAESDEIEEFFAIAT